MNRLVEQLLSVARLDAVALDVSAEVDLNQPAKDVIVSLAPWAVAQNRALGFIADRSPGRGAGQQLRHLRCGAEPRRERRRACAARQPR